MGFSCMRYLLGFFCAIMIGASPVAAAQLSETGFYQQLSGNWSGPGEIVAGRYKGTRFICDFLGKPVDANVGIDIGGNCRVGVFSQPVTASFERKGRGFTGRFLDGEAGEGMDVTGGQYSPAKLIVDIKRKDLRGLLSARLTREDKLNITISVRVESRIIPVIGMSLVRKPGSERTVKSVVTE